MLLKEKLQGGGGIQSLLIHEANRGPGPAAIVLAKTRGAFCTIPDTCQTSTKAILLEFGTESVVHQGPFCFNDDCCHSFDTVIFFYPPVPNALQESCCSLKRGEKVVILSSELTGDVIFYSKLPPS